MSILEFVLFVAYHITRLFHSDKGNPIDHNDEPTGRITWKL